MSANLLDRADLWEVWQGDCLNAETAERVMAGRKADLLCFDAPYSPRTHDGHDASSKGGSETFRNGDSSHAAYERRIAAGLTRGRREISYSFWSPVDVRNFCDAWIPHTDGWIVTITDDALAPAWRTSFLRHNLYPFAPLPLLETGSRVRLAGDGPSNWTCWIVVARPRSKQWSKWGTLRGGYVVPTEQKEVVGGKSLLAMQQIVMDYSRRGDLVVDPTSGGGTTLRAALGTGRRAIGLELDPGRAELSAKACRAVNLGQGELFTEAR